MADIEPDSSVEFRLGQLHMANAALTGRVDRLEQVTDERLGAIDSKLDCIGVQLTQMDERRRIGVQIAGLAKWLLGGAVAAAGWAAGHFHLVGNSGGGH